jgi:hypothetical protein
MYFYVTMFRGVTAWFHIVILQCIVFLFKEINGENISQSQQRIRSYEIV